MSIVTAPLSRRRRLGRRAALLALAVLCHAPAVFAGDFLWKVSRNQSVLYLVGSVHLLSNDYYPLSPTFEQAFKDADLLVEEVDFGEMLSPESQLQTLMRGMLPLSQSLDTVVSPATYSLVTKRLEELGMPVEPLKRFKPWALAILLMNLEWQKAGFSGDLGLDRHLYDRARSEGKKVLGLETTEYQISRFDGMTKDQQERMLSDSVRTVGAEVASVGILADAWKAGDLPTLERIILEDLRQDPEVYQRLLVERNRNWLPTLEELLNRGGRPIVVVGAAHLVGPDGLLALFKAKGYAVDQQ
jgi:uncharacterized protein YbaP (TraB family)